MQTRLFLDTNILVRYLIGDVEDHKKYVVHLFDTALKENKILIILPEVLVELNYVLSHHYEIDKKLIISSLGSILKISVIQIHGIKDFDQVLSIYQNHNLSLEDSLFISYCIQNKLDFVSFDKKALRVFRNLV
jgi:predicted nucleic acid-binding protein